jgi:hypothetical protein
MKPDPALEGDDDRVDLDCTKLTRLTIVITPREKAVSVTGERMT